MAAENKNILVVCGPNASGKTQLGVKLALCIGGEIISADSRQVYRGMDIGTGKDLEEYSTEHGRVPYHLIDTVEPSQVYTLYHYQRDCYAAIRAIWARKKNPVIVGGTGLYIEAVLKYYEIADVPEDPDLRKAFMAEPKAKLLTRLKMMDPELYSRTDLSSKKRIVRALELARYARIRPVNKKRENPPQMSPLVMGVQWPRQELIERINKRLHQRLKQGMVEEVRQLLLSGISRERFSLFGMEYKHIARFIDGEVGYEQMVQQLQTDIHRLAKRQMTWFRGMERRGIPIEWIDRADSEEAMAVVGKNVFRRT
jgi:tRNA dimethylallyltransferase